VAALVFIMADILDATPTPPVEPPPTNPITGSPQNVTSPPAVPSDSLIVPPAPEPPVTAPSPQQVKPPPGPAPKLSGKKRPGAGTIIAGLLLLLLTLPVAVFYISQQQSTSDVRSRAANEGAYPTAALLCKGALQSCDDQNPCCSGQNLYCMGTEGSRTCQQDDGTIGQCPDGGTCNKINAYHCSSLSNGECHDNKVVDVGNMDAGRAHAAGCGQVDVVCRGGSKDNLLCGGFSVINSSCTTPTGNPPGDTPTPTNPPAGPQCTRMTVYKNGEVYTDYNNLKSGDAITICVKGGNDEKARLRVNGGSWTEVTTKNSSDEYCMDFTIPSGTTQFTIEAEVYGNGSWK
jgi:hypothetical protein